MNYKLRLSLLVLAAAALSYTAARANETQSDAPEKGLKMAKSETVIFVDDLHCKTCAKKISGKLYAVKSVARVRTHVKKDYAIVTPQKGKQLNVAKLWKASQDAGFQPTRLAGPTGIYLPDAESKGPVKQVEKVADARG